MRTAAALGGEDFGDVLGEQSRSVDRLVYPCEDVLLLFLFFRVRRGGRRREVSNTDRIFLAGVESMVRYQCSEADTEGEERRCVR